MKLRTLAFLAIFSTFTLAGCGSGAETKEVDPETEAAKWLDETGSNLDYANEKAAQACADLK